MNDRPNLKMSRRNMLKLVAVSGAGATLAACTPAATATTAPTSAPVVEPTATEAKPVQPASKVETGKLVCLLCCGTNDTHELQTNFNTYFHETYPSMEASLELTPAGTNYFEKLQTLFAAGTPPDVFDMWEGYVQPYAANGALLDMSPFIATSAWKMDDFQPAAVAASSFQGKMYSIVRDFYPGPAMFFYNKDLFDKAKIEYPSFDWDWNKMAAAAKALTLDTTGGKKTNQWGLAFDNWFVVWLHWIWSNGGDLFNADETKCALVDPKAYEPLQFFADLINKDKCALPSSEASAMQGTSNAFRTGALGMFMGNAWDVADMKAAKTQGLNWGCLLPPKAPATGKRSFYMHLECWAAAKTTKVPNAAWQYIYDFTSTHFLGDFISFYPGIPLLKKDINMFVTDENRTYGWDKIPDIIADPKNIRIPGAGAKFDKISGLVQAELDLAFTGAKTAQAAVETAAPLVDAELARTSGLVGPDCHCRTASLTAN